MSKMTNVSIRYMRRVQPVDYQPAESEVSMSLVIDDGDDVSAEIRSAMGIAKARVDEALGLGGKAPAAKAANVKQTTAEPKPTEPVTATVAAKESAVVDNDPFGVSGGDGPDMSDLPQGEIDNALLGRECSAAARRLNGDTEKVKAKIAEFKVARVAEIAQDKRRDFIRAIRGLK